MSAAELAFRRALDLAEQAVADSGGADTIVAIRNQLRYLVDVTTGARTDRERLREVNMGQLARDLGDDDFTKAVYAACAFVGALSNDAGIDGRSR